MPTYTTDEHGCIFRDGKLFCLAAVDRFTNPDADMRATAEELCEQLRRADSFRLAKRMAANMALMIDWPHEDCLIRAGGDAICDACGLTYHDHPYENGLVLACDGRLLKL